MSMENVVAVQIPPDKLQTMQTHVSELRSLLSPYLIAINSEQRLKMPKMGDGTEPFVEKAIDYSKSDPAFMPPFMSAEDMEIDFKAVKELTSLYKPLKQLLSNLEDTITTSGSEAYVGALSYYNSVKLGSRMNAKGAKSIYEDLRKRFEGQRKKGSNDNGEA